MALYKALYGRKSRSPVHWDKAGERQFLRPELVEQATEAIKKIRERMKTAQSRQKSYANCRRRLLEFEPSKKVFLKISPTKGITRFRKRGKLNPRFIGPFEVLERIGKVAYRLALPPSLSGVHDIFHVSMLRKYIADPSHILRYPEVEVTPDLRQEVEHERILESSEKELRNKVIRMVKVKWKGHPIEEVTWEVKENICSNYPSLF